MKSVGSIHRRDQALDYQLIPPVSSCLFAIPTDESIPDTPTLRGKGCNLLGPRAGGPGGHAMSFFRSLSVFAEVGVTYFRSDMKLGRLDLQLGDLIDCSSFRARSEIRCAFVGRDREKARGDRWNQSVI